MTLLNGKMAKSVSHNLQKEMILSTDSASDHVGDEKEKKREKKTGRGEERAGRRERRRGIRGKPIKSPAENCV